jgi:putative ABC transport system permease protein
MSLITRFVSLFHSHRLDQDLQEELRAHMEMRAEDNMADGMTEEEARLDARRKLGNPAVLTENMREQDTFQWLETVWQDVRYGLRQIRKNPGFSLMAVLIVTIGVGASTTLFSVTDTVLRKGIGVYPNSERWAVIWAFFPRQNQRVYNFTIPEYLDLRNQSQIFEKTGILVGFNGTLKVDHSPELTECTRISVDAIPMTGVRPLLGRNFLAEEDRPGGPGVAILSYELWQRRLHGNPNILNTSITLDDENYSVVGIMPPRYDLWGGELWMPFQLDVANGDRSNRRIRIAVLLRKDLSEQQANARLQELATRWTKEHAGTNPEYEGMKLSFWNAHEWVVRGYKTSLMILLAAVGLLILLSCANLGSLLLSKASTRRREMALRSALGARRGRIVRQLVVESLILSFVGGGLGVTLAIWGVPAAVSLVPELPNGGQAALTPVALLTALAVTIVTGVLFGIAPALYSSRTDLTTAFKETRGQAGLSGAGHVLRNVLVVAEIAVSLVILAGGVLTIRTFRQLSQLDLGFRPRNVLTMEVTLPVSRYRQPNELVEFFHRLMPRLQALPGVQYAAVTTGHPMRDRSVDISFQDFELEGKQGQKDTPNANFRVITPDYFRVMGTRLLSGRYFSDDDDASHPGVVIVNKTMAKLFWPDGSPLGKRLRLGSRTGEFIADPHAIDGADANVDPWVTVVGVVDDAKQIDVIEAPVRQEMFLPLMQRGSRRDMTLMFRSELEPATLTDAARHAVQGLDPELPIHGVFTLDQLVSDAFGPKRLTMMLLVFFGVTGVTLAVVGLYAVVAFSVRQRTGEIGVRMALGARRIDILKVMLNVGLRLGFLGILVGLPASFGASRVLRSLFVNIDPVDSVTLAAVCAGLGIVILLASYWPSLRATRLDPMVALRHE